VTVNLLIERFEMPVNYYNRRIISSRYTHASVLGRCWLGDRNLEGHPAYNNSALRIPKVFSSVVYLIRSSVSSMKCFFLAKEQWIKSILQKFWRIVSWAVFAFVWHKGQQWKTPGQESSRRFIDHKIRLVSAVCRRHSTQVSATTGPLN